ncbi:MULTISPECIES: L-arabinose ABC transporter permease AraH [Ralstonia solanacearum species complex]|nr:L-arabinose ABC transporter permease AraH [Ralstonia pseudosolanacearum]AKZ25589.1 L-arabinose transporter permease [Ralstonia solanacearum]APF85983.1 L-arabinose ABC transporter permease AraH [Ralstonia solanacearum FJAT-1458]ARS57096.1 L-arabinose ABC transporter permease AraH [Ralstonia solanacearum FJAT-91]AVV68122.1 L-arabinose ABC transporter permease AraH [Ralstonia solanacearum OE1-1]ESS49154.1 L-arabinose transporter permease [Ralstonia solanacearum SD54]QUP57622.1 L-arabinose ABC
MSQSQPLQRADGFAASARSAMNNTRLLRRLDDFSLPLIFAILFAALSLSVEYFFSWQNMVGLALSVSQIGMVACTMMFCLASRDFDLSIGSTVAFAGVLCATVINATGSIALGIGASLLAGAVIGGINGFVIARLKINALITTLATMEIVRGLAFIASHGQAVGVSEMAFFDLGNTIVLGVPTPVWVAALCFVAFGVLLNKTVYGRNTLAIGGNPEAARLAGVNVNLTRIVIFLVQGVIAALAGVILAARITSGQPNAAQGFELNVISACVLGGVSLMGGRASISGVLVGVLIMGTVQNAMNLLNIDAFYQYLVRGGILLAAVLVDQIKHRGGRD